MELVASYAWHFLLFLAYTLVISFTVYHIIKDTRSTPKTLAYLLLILVLPFLGSIFYFTFGGNYRHMNSYKKLSRLQHSIDKDYFALFPMVGDLSKESKILEDYKGLSRFIEATGGEPPLPGKFELLKNGEVKFPELLKSLEAATHHIHIEYYIWENDHRGNDIKEKLISKRAGGVQVRVLYDDFGSRGIKKNIVLEMEKAGIEVYPKLRIRLKKLANRLNHRDHRKIVIIDGTTAFVGGINISDYYDNSIKTEPYWRDTHIKITGALVKSLQRHFIVSWNATIAKKIGVQKMFFPDIEISKTDDPICYGQVVAGGPTYDHSPIMFSYLRLFSLAKKSLYICNPYFIPNESVMDALKQTALSGVDVRLMIPKDSDSAFVGAASRFYFESLLLAGVRIFLYKKGFLHAKTVVVDGMVSIVGTANMDIRSFELNFEIMTVIYGKSFAEKMDKMFYDDLIECEEISLDDWNTIGELDKTKYALARLASSFM